MDRNADHVIEISVDGDGQVYHGDNPVSLDQLRARLGMAAQSAGLSIALKPRTPDAVDFNRMLEVMKLVQDSGFANVSLVAGQMRQ